MNQVQVVRKYNETTGDGVFIVRFNGGAQKAFSFNTNRDGIWDEKTNRDEAMKYPKHLEIYGLTVEEIIYETSNEI